jgi:hypothetical protein
MTVQATINSCKTPRTDVDKNQDKHRWADENPPMS